MKTKKPADDMAKTDVDVDAANALAPNENTVQQKEEETESKQDENIPEKNQSDQTPEAKAPSAKKNKATKHSDSKQGKKFSKGTREKQ